jgi:carbohydrate-binding DOMON domain-containing protein
LVLVGGGIRIQDQQYRTLAAYVPAEFDAADPIGDASTATIRFALPVTLLGLPEAGWTFTVLVGAQDDHGGAGIGEFRTVNREAGEWFGGGKMNPEESNIYDMLVAPVR